MRRGAILGVISAPARQYGHAVDDGSDTKSTKFSELDEGSSSFLGSYRLFDRVTSARCTQLLEHTTWSGMPDQELGLHCAGM